MSQDEFISISKEYGLEVRRFSLNLSQVYSVILHNPVLEGGQQCLYRRPDQLGMFPDWYLSVEKASSGMYVLARRRNRIEGRVYYVDEKKVEDTEPDWLRKNLESVLELVERAAQEQAVSTIAESGRTLIEVMK